MSMSEKLGLLGRKVGMMRIFTDDGDAIPVTVLDVSNNRVTQVKTAATDGYDALQVTFGSRKASRVNKPEAGHLAKAGVEAGEILRRFLDTRRKVPGPEHLKTLRTVLRLGSNLRDQERLGEAELLLRETLDSSRRALGLESVGTIELMAALRETLARSRKFEESNALAIKHLAASDRVFGKHHPCVVWAQYTPYAELQVLGGIMGQNLFLEDFAPIVQQYRARWFPGALEVHTCCDPAGSHDNSQGVKLNGVSVLTDLGFSPTYKVDSNSPSIRAATIERLAGYMRRRSPMGEAFGIDTERWLRISPEGVIPMKFLTDGLEVGYVWDQHMVSVGSKQIRKPKKDGWYEHGQNCLEYLEHNFGGVQPTLEQAMQHANQVRGRDARRAQKDDPVERDFQKMLKQHYGVPVSSRRGSGRRGGY